MLTKQLSDILQGLQSPGNFYATGTQELFPPCLEVNQVGRISLPLLPVQAEQLVEVADRAPYGKGYETLVDTDVRRTWQIDASKVNLSGKYWQKNLSSIVNQVKLGLGVDCEITAELYKLLVYDTGSFFVPHRDTEKADGMFATLIIVLPSVYSGGELLIRHQHEETKLDLRSQAPEETSFAAFYADCVHEVLPVTDGCRLTLVYNLIRTDKKFPLPTPPDYRRAQDKAAALLNNWSQNLNTKTDDTNDIPEKLIYLLEHEYSIAELKFDALKNKDAASAEALREAAKQADCDLYLALVSIEESGSAEHTGGGYYNRWGDDDEDEGEFEIGEVFEHWETISEWRSPEGSKPTLPTLPFKAEEFCPPEAFERMEPEDIEFQEATGNAGASFERMYHCAALVLWPRSRYLAIINQAGLSAALLVLNDLCQQWESNKKEETKLQAYTLATYIFRDWIPHQCSQTSVYDRSEYIPGFLNCLFRLADISLIKKFWLIIAKTGIYKKQDSLALVQASALLPWTDVVDYATATITVSAVKAQEACIALLAGLCNNRDQHERQQLSTATLSLLTTLPGDPKRFPDLLPWQQQRMVLSTSDVADMLISFSMIDSHIAEKTLDYMLAWPRIYDMDKVLLPTALLITESKADNTSPAIVRLYQLVITHLQSRLAKHLTPPADWSRDNAVSCSCKDCSELSQFLASADQEQWRFKAAEARRQHVQHSISMNKCDLDFVTEKTNRPYSLICTKNQASYQRRVELSQNDQQALASLLAVFN